MFLLQSSFKYESLVIRKCKKDQLKVKPKNMAETKFGALFSDHMVNCDWETNIGWKNPEIIPMQPFKIHPASKVLHYASELFEGMKAYRGVDNKIRLFRADMNMQRMLRTAERCALPTFDPEEAIKIISEQIKIDESWVPYSDVASLYIRPTLIGTEGTLGVSDSNSAKFFVLTGPAGAYFATGFKPVTLLADSRYVRAFPGGVGQFKMGCNYAPTLLIGKEAAKKGCQQVLWLSGDNEEVTEAGTMNFFVYWKNEEGQDELITSSLDKGLILPGVTRQSLIDLAKNFSSIKVTERNFTMNELIKAIKEKRIYQAFGSGTAAVVCPVGKILYHNRETSNYEELTIPTMETSDNLMEVLYKNIVDIQYGRVEHPGWTRVVC
ncbi:Branched-chain-amino-acid aminotransferase [Strongyloides ratti]|uniref:Branched-chain-amino-acid aminotransferase n=1 Tax=Strongyloides ratti TaxID=34506 RepID=A0A090LS01_STRRB|nr:Branched-chain-amino-acid aminotransferase [Strongyloides ratti]CEF70368.1 Branched-chain-amino-acid aminotransferase [Strongyloides ratti]